MTHFQRQAIRALQLCTDWRAALAVLDALPTRHGVLPDLHCYSAAITACVRSSGLANGTKTNMNTKKDEEPMAHFKSMQAPPNLQREGLEGGREAHCLKGLEEGEKLLHRVLDEGRLKPTSALYNPLITAYGRTKQWQKAFLMLDRMAANKVQPDAISYNACLAPCDKTDASSTHATSLISRMCRDRIVPTLVTYNTLLAHIGVRCEWRTALGVMNTMNSSRVDPDVISFTSTINACEEVPQEALEVFDTMKQRDIQPNSLTYTAVVKSLANRDQGWIKALDVLKEMQDNNVDGDLIFNNALLTVLPSEKAEQYLAHMPERDLISYNAVLKTYYHAQEWEKSLRFFQWMLVHGEVSVSDSWYKTITSDVDVGIRKSNNSEAHGYNWNDDKVTNSRHPRGSPVADMVSVNTVLAVLGKCGRWKEAFRILRGVQWKELNSNYIHRLTTTKSSVFGEEESEEEEGNVQGSQMDRSGSRECVIIDRSGESEKKNAEMRMDGEEREWSTGVLVENAEKRHEIMMMVEEKHTKEEREEYRRVALTCGIEASIVARKFTMAEALYEEGYRGNLWTHRPQHGESKLTVDFHDFRQPVALAGFRWILRHESPKLLVVITGKGLHRRDGTDGVLKTVLWDEAHDRLKLNPEHVRGNEGRFTVSYESWKGMQRNTVC